MVWKDLRDEDPDDRPLTNRVRCDKSEDASGNDCKIPCLKCPGTKTKRGDVADRSDIKQCLATKPVDQPQSDKVNIRLVTPIPMDCNKAALSSSPVNAKMRFGLLQVYIEGFDCCVVSDRYECRQVQYSSYLAASTADKSLASLCFRNH